jgi:hypothetical protein
MRELISFGALAVLMSVLASSVFGGNVEECEVLKDGATKGLYGLCIAYHNAGSSDGKERILNNYNKKAGPDDPPMPGTGDPVPCACWTDKNMTYAIGFADPLTCHIGTVLEDAVYGENAIVVWFFVDEFRCFYEDPDGMMLVNDLDPEVEQACRDGIHALVDLDFGGSCP